MSFLCFKRTGLVFISAKGVEVVSDLFFLLPKDLFQTELIINFLSIFFFQVCQIYL